MPEEHERGTGTLAGARDHARRQAGEVGESTDVVVPGRVVWTDVIGPGDYAAVRLPRGAVLRLTDPEGDACAQLLVHNARQPAERLNVADTVKVQWQAYLAAGAQLLSDMGRVLMTIVDDTSARHDCLCGSTTRATATARYGTSSVSDGRPSGRDLLALGVAKLGLARGDVGPCVNLFKSARVEADGALRFDGSVRPGTYVELRAELDVLVTLANTPHPLDERASYTITPVECVAWMPDEADEIETATPERRRAVENTAAFLAGVLQ